MILTWAKGLTLATALLSATLSTATFAQQPPPDEPPRERETEAAQESEPAPTRGSSEDSPYDYQASEEISEDLSVSFPVDI